MTNNNNAKRERREQRKIEEKTTFKKDPALYIAGSLPGPFKMIGLLGLALIRK